MTYRHRAGDRRQRLLRWCAATVGSARASVRQSGRRQRLIGAAVASIVAIAAVAGIVVFAASSDGAPDQAAGSSAYEHSGKAGNADLSMLGGHHRAKLAPATSSPAPAPASVATAAPLASHEVFGFAPYWTLDQSTTYDVAGSTTIAYFAVGINPDGTLDESGSGWNGYESQDLVNLIDRAHAAGVRVVLTVNDFDQQSLDQLTSSPTAPATLAQALIGAVEAKDLDGVNLDLEGDGSADQAGLTNLVGQVSTALHQVNPHWQVTMDTYASSAGDPNGFYDIPALANVVDGFFVMQYSPNLSGSAQATSPLTSSLFNDVTTAGQYAAAVPASKVILGAPLFGLDWPTNGDTLTAVATGPVTDLRVQPDRHRRPPDVLGPGHRFRLDRVPGRDPVARVVLRRPDVPLRRLSARPPLRARRRRRVGPRDGRLRRHRDAHRARRDRAVDHVRAVARDAHVDDHGTRQLVDDVDDRQSARLEPRPRHRSAVEPHRPPAARRRRRARHRPAARRRRPHRQ